MKFKVGDILKRVNGTYRYKILGFNESGIYSYYSIKNVDTNVDFEFGQEVVEDGFRKLTKLELALQ